MHTRAPGASCCTTRATQPPLIALRTLARGLHGLRLGFEAPEPNAGQEWLFLEGQRCPQPRTAVPGALATPASQPGPVLPCQARQATHAPDSRGMRPCLLHPSFLGQNNGVVCGRDRAGRCQGTCMWPRRHSGRTGEESGGSPGGGWGGCLCALPASLSGSPQALPILGQRITWLSPYLGLRLFEMVLWDFPE